MKKLILAMVFIIGLLLLSSCGTEVSQQPKLKDPNENIVEEIKVKEIVVNEIVIR